MKCTDTETDISQRLKRVFFFGGGGGGEQRKKLKEKELTIYYLSLIQNALSSVKTYERLKK